MCQWKNFENRSTFAEVRQKSSVLLSFSTWCRHWIITVNRKSYKLCISLFQKCTPEFIFLSGMHEHQSAIVGWQTIINNNICPASKPPELKAESANISIRSGETLFWRNNSVKKIFKLTQAWDSREKPTITCNRMPFVTSSNEVQDTLACLSNIMKVIHMLICSTLKLQTGDVIFVKKIKNSFHHPNLPLLLFRLYEKMCIQV